MKLSQIKTETASFIYIINNSSKKIHRIDPNKAIHNWDQWKKDVE
jgi:hypothetical protein